MVKFRFLTVGGIAAAKAFKIAAFKSHVLVMTSGLQDSLDARDSKEITVKDKDIWPTIVTIQSHAMSVRAAKQSCKFRKPLKKMMVLVGDNGASQSGCPVFSGHISCLPCIARISNHNANLTPPAFPHRS